MAAAREGGMWEGPQSGKAAVLPIQIIALLRMSACFCWLVGCSRCEDRLVVAACHSTPILPPAAATVLCRSCCSLYPAVLDEGNCSGGSYLYSVRLHVILVRRPQAPVPVRIALLRAALFIRVRPLRAGSATYKLLLLPVDMPSSSGILLLCSLPPAFSCCWRFSLLPTRCRSGLCCAALLSVVRCCTALLIAR